MVLAPTERWRLKAIEIGEPKMTFLSTVEITEAWL